MIFIFILLMSYVTNALTSVNNEVMSVVDARIERRAISEVQDAARLARLFILIHNRYPISQAEVETFAISVGERFPSENIRILHVPLVVGSLFQYERLIIYIQDNKQIVLESEFTAQNTCGTGLNDPSGYCAPNDAKYTVLNSDAHIQNMVRTMNFRINETFYKVSQAYDGRTVGFPRRKASGLDLSDNTSATLADFVGYAGTPASCRGTYRFARMFLNCSDLFDDTGNPIVYYYKNSREVYLVVTTPFKDASGNAINISRYARV
jgi:hypothetical protein